MVYLKERYGVNLEWVKIFKLVQPWYKSYFKIGGFCATRGFAISDEFSSISVRIPIVCIGSNSSTRHELIHAARNFGFGDYKRNKEFEEMIAHDRYNKIFVMEMLSDDVLLGKDTQVFGIRKARKILKRYFGAMHGYVFIRLTCREILKFVVAKDNSYGNPLRYLRVMGESQLKHRIMCEKLGLWKYDIL